MNVKSETIFTEDNIHILRGMENEMVDLIYLDPPFNKKKTFSAPIGSKAAGAAFKDTWTLNDEDHQWHGEIKGRNPALYAVIEAAGRAYDSGMQSYLIMMAIRLLEMRRILKGTGSIYLHCDPTASHYLKAVMDSVFGGKNFIDEIVWNYGTPSGGRVSGKKPVKAHEVLLVYAKKYGKHTYNKQFMPYSEKYVTDWFRHTDEDGRKYQTRSRKGAIVRQYLDKSPGVPLSNVWSDIMQLYSSAGWFPKKNDERTGYPTQKPLALLKRIIATSSNEGDMILDPFCGCATALVAAHDLKRKWIGVDISEMANRLVRDRMEKDLGLFSLTIIHRTDIPKRKGRRSKKIKDTLYGRQSGYCNLCGIHFLKVNLTVDHIIPRDHGGLDDDDNLQLLCQRCNSIKSTGTMEKAMVKIKKEQEKAR